LLEGNGISVVVLIGASIAVTSSIARLEERVTALEKNLDRVRDKVNVASPGGDASGAKDADKQDDDKDPASAAQTQPDPLPAPAPVPSVQPTVRGLKAVPTSIPAQEPSVCVERGSYVIFDCLLAKQESCYGKVGFTPSRFEDLKRKSGVDSDALLLCDKMSP
jgi:hypothetical protein